MWCLLTFQLQMWAVVMMFQMVLQGQLVRGNQPKEEFKGKYTDVDPYVAMVGSSVSLPCNVTPPSSDDNVVLILWYRDDTNNPIYSIDARITSLDKAKHFPGEVLSNRSNMTISFPLSYLHLNPVKQDDGGEYRCRVDFRKERTVNRIVKLNIIVPISQISIYDERGLLIRDIAGPFREDEQAILICEAEGGKPPPGLRWYRGQSVIDETYSISPKGTTVNKLTLASLKREDLMVVLSCKGTNTDLIPSMSRSIAIDMNLKPTNVKIVAPEETLSAGVALNIVCHVSGSKPQATINWLLGDKTLVPIEQVLSEDRFVTTSSISFVPSIDDNGKRLSCIGRNIAYPLFALDDGFILHVTYPPMVSLVLGASAPQDRIVEGSDIIFECNIQANPPVQRIGWKYNQMELTSTLVKERQLANVMISNTSLVLRNVQENASGSYTCWATNEEGRRESSPITVEIQYAPRCRSVKSIYGFWSKEKIAISCEVDAKPSTGVTFHWSLGDILAGNSSTSLSAPTTNINNSNNHRYRSNDITGNKIVGGNESGIVQSLSSITSEGLHSTAYYTPSAGEPQEYQVLHCWASNSVGKQLEPCVFYIVPVGPPDTPENCTVGNITMHSLTVYCKPGYSSLDQVFHLEVYTSKNGLLVGNQTSVEYPFFKVSSLPPGQSFVLRLFSSNDKGRSPSLSLKGSTLLASQLYSGNEEDIIATIPLATLLGLTFILFLLSTIVFVISRSKKDMSRGTKEGEENSSRSRYSNGGNKYGLAGEEKYEDGEENFQEDRFGEECENELQEEEIQENKRQKVVNKSEHSNKRSGRVKVLNDHRSDDPDIKQVFLDTENEKRETPIGENRVHFLDMSNASENASLSLNSADLSQGRFINIHLSENSIPLSNERSCIERGIHEHIYVHNRHSSPCQLEVLQPNTYPIIEIQQPCENSNEDPSSHGDHGQQQQQTPLQAYSDIRGYVTEVYCCDASGNLAPYTVFTEASSKL